MADESGLLKLDPAGNHTPYGRISWDEQGQTNIVRILIWYDDSRIRSIQFQYAEDGKLVLSNRHLPSRNFVNTKAYKFVAVSLYLLVDMILFRSLLLVLFRQWTNVSIVVCAAEIKLPL